MITGKLAGLTNLGLGAEPAGSFDGRYWVCYLVVGKCRLEIEVMIQRMTREFLIWE
ncbi:hypothetical protein D3C79_567180 [compost metagenome]